MGGGGYLLFCISFLTQNDVKIEAIIESGNERAGTLLHGFEITTIDKVIKQYPEKIFDIVISAPKFRDEIRQILCDSGFMDEQIHCFETEIYTPSSKYKNFLTKNLERLYSVYSTLQDSKSKKVLLAIVKGRVTADFDCIRDIYEGNQYWPSDIICFSDRETIIESGSSDGATLLQMYETLNGRFDKIYCFEPNENAFKLLEKALKLLNNDKRISLIKKGTYSKSATLSFHINDVSLGSSHLSEGASSTVGVVALDDLMTDEITYIKMDVEGAELDTLRGTENIIRRYRPKLAICIYHRDEDIIDIPLYLRNIMPDYRFYIRHHNISMTETVLYAV